jgi:flagellar biogenesis protein FliO
VKLLLGSLILAALLYAAARGVRRLPIGKLLPSSDGPIKVIGRTHLGPKGTLCLLEVSGTTLLLAITPGGIQTLHVWPEGRGPGADVPAAATGPRAAALPGQLRGLETRLGGNRG